MNFSALVMAEPLEDVMDNVKQGDQFKLEISKDDTLLEGETYFVKETGLENEKFETVFEFGDLDAIDDWRCGIKLSDFEMP